MDSLELPRKPIVDVADFVAHPTSEKAETMRRGMHRAVEIGFEMVLAAVSKPGDDCDLPALECVIDRARQMRGIITTSGETLFEFGELAQAVNELEDFARDFLLPDAHGS